MSPVPLTANNSMANDTAPKKNHRALRKLVGSVAIAGAVYAAEKYIESRRKKRALKKKSSTT